MSTKITVPKTIPGVLRLAQSGFALWAAVALFVPSPKATAAPMDRGQIQTAKDQMAVPISSQSKVTFKPEGPLGFKVELDDSGKPVMVKDKNNKYVGVGGGTTWYRASDGEKVFTLYRGLVSQDDASEYLKKKLVGAEILKREPRTNDKGEVFGERIVAYLSVPVEAFKKGPDDPHRRISAVINTDNIKCLYSEITSDSLDDALAFERTPDAKK